VEVDWTESNSNDITKTSFRGVPPGNPTSKSRSPGDNGNGATFTNVAPNTIYAFSARNCDEFTCTDWSKVVDFNSGPATPSGVQLVLQGAKSFPMGSATVGPNRSFSTRIRVDKTVPPGKYTLVAERGGADEASAPLTVVTSGQLTPTIQFVDQVTGTTSSSSRVIVGNKVFVRGEGFAQGPVKLSLDTLNGTVLSTATASGSPPMFQVTFPFTVAGKHQIIASQNQGTKVVQASGTMEGDIIQ
jgi:hypothetical protein